MNILSAITGLGSAIAGPIVDYFDNRAAEKARAEELKQALHEKRLDHIRASEQDIHEWEMKSIDNSGWRDEYLTVSLSLPLIGVVSTDAVQDHIRDAFTVLESTPEWYRWMVGVMVGSAFGVKALFDFAKKRKGGEA